ncbi:MAG: CocE/NonD family hydrolase, partial [Lachnospiraceae bacterium]|nr:CocE/NonD family hydrolase [Lachnospiraceae bacterium]
SADLYYQTYPNGVSILPDMKMPKMPAKVGVPVDEDPAPDYPMAHEAVLGHDFNMGFLEQYLPDMHRDSMNYRIGYAPNMEIPVWNAMDKVRFSGTAVYPYGAFYEPGCTNKIFEYRAWGGRLLLGPWRYCEVYRETNDFPEGVFDWKTDHLRWFDHFLKGEENGVTEEPPVLYYTTDDEKPWHRSADFPLDDQTNPSLYLTADGKLTEDIDAGTGAADGAGDADAAGSAEMRGGVSELKYRVRDDITIIEGMGRLNRRIDRDLREEAAKCLTFTTEALPEDLELTGFPVVELYAKSTYSDGIFLAELLEILPDGKAHFLTDGMLRGRSAKLSRHPILDPIGVPYHSSLMKDDVKLSADRPAFLAFHLESLSKVVKKGSKL